MTKAEAKAAYMRAKWARERTERSIDRLNGDLAHSATPAERKTINASLKDAKSILAQRTRAERETKAAYDEAKKAPKIDPVNDGEGDEPNPEDLPAE